VRRGMTIGTGLVLLCALAACTETPPLASSTQQSDMSQPAPQEPQDVPIPAKAQPKVSHLDHSGRAVKGIASYYGPHFANRKMANGRHLDPNSNVIASKTLPFGTTVKVTNPANGRSATVTVADRGPYVKGRVVDVTPKVADELDLRQKGVGSVVVAPIAVPQPNGAVKLGAGAADASPAEVEKATEATKAAVR
jgi:rare lipoprotein A